MNLKDFINKINNAIVERGYQYYVDNNIVNWSVENNIYTFTVNGNNLYEVTVELNDMEIVQSFCDCPFNQSAICKHQVAAFYKLLELKMNKEDDSDENKLLRYMKNIDFEFEICKLPRKKLINIILELTKDNKPVQDELLINNCNLDQNLGYELCKEMIDDIIGKYYSLQLEGENDYTALYIYEMKNVINRIEAIYHNDKNYRVAFDCAIYAYRNIIAIWELYSEFEDEVEEMLIDIETIIKNISLEVLNINLLLAQYICLKLKDESKSDLYSSFLQYKFSLITLATIFAKIPYLKDKIEAEIQSVINIYNEDKYNALKGDLLLAWINVIEDGLDYDEIEVFINNNLNYPQIRKKAIDRAKTRNNHKKVLQLSLEGEEIESSKNVLALWKKYRLEAYESLKLIDEELKLQIELLLDEGILFLKELKLAKGTDFIETYKAIIKELREKQDIQSEELRLFLIEEQDDKEELIKFVKSHNEYVFDYSNKLLADYRVEVINIYKQLILKAAQKARNKSQYKEVILLIKKAEPYMINEELNKLINKIMKLYSGRKGFVEELRRIKDETVVISYQKK